MSAKKNNEEKNKKIAALEVSLDSISVEEKKPAPAPKKIYMNRDEDEDESGNDWGMPTKKNTDFDDEDDLEPEDKEAFSEIEEDEVFFREKGPKSQGGRLNVDRDKDGRRVGKGFNTFIDATLPEELTKDLPDAVKEVLKK
jgi:hypothetical protein